MPDQLLKASFSDQVAGYQATGYDTRDYTLYMAEFRDLANHSKAPAIRHLREIFDISLVQAKDFVESIAAIQRQAKTKELLGQKFQEIVDEAYRAGLTKGEIGYELTKIGF